MQRRKIKKLSNENKKLVKLCSQLKIDLNRMENFSFSNGNFNTMRNSDYGNFTLTKLNSNNDFNNNYIEENEKEEIELGCDKIKKKEERLYIQRKSVRKQKVKKNRNFV